MNRKQCVAISLCLIIGFTTNCRIAEAECSNLDPGCNETAAGLVGSAIGLFDVVIPPVTSSLTLWLRADAGVSNSASSLVWTDQSGNGHDVQQTDSGSRPVLETDRINGLPAFQFFNTENLTGTVSTFAGGDPSMTVFAVYELHASDTMVAVSAGTEGTNKNLGIGWNTANGHNFFQWGSAQSDSGGTTNTWVIRGATRDPLLSMVSRLNGTTATSSTPAAATIDSTFHVGRSGSDLSPFYFSGYIAEVILYNTVLSDTDAALVECYLSDRYRIAVAHACD